MLRFWVSIGFSLLIHTEFCSAFCPKNGISGSTAGSCFFGLELNKTFDDANNFCATYFNGKLASITTPLDDSKVLELARSFFKSAENVWLGGTYDGSKIEWLDGSPDVYQNFVSETAPGKVVLNLKGELTKTGVNDLQAWILFGGQRTGPGVDDWKWSDGSPWNYTNWAPGEPNSGDSHCVRIYADVTNPAMTAKWDDWPSVDFAYKTDGWCGVVATGQCCPLWRPYPSTIISVKGHVVILIGNTAIVRRRISGLWGGQRMIGVGCLGQRRKPDWNRASWTTLDEKVSLNDFELILDFDDLDDLISIDH
ncbi:unnamed protein product, partial [Mesorhabditis belari]|uniref:C-type lectin domain-containing protein n=1 Tax=Mesorhabditis belari TaxID=2138241 RepID=A0AAF3FC07_9BILA